IRFQLAYAILVTCKLVRGRGTWLPYSRTRSCTPATATSSKQAHASGTNARGMNQNRELEDRLRGVESGEKMLVGLIANGPPWRACRVLPFARPVPRGHSPPLRDIRSRRPRAPPPTGREHH